MTYTDRGAAVATFPEWGGLDISFLDARATHEGWTVRMRMPDRETLEAFRDLCAEKDVAFTLQSIYEEIAGGLRASPSWHGDAHRHDHRHERQLKR